MPDLTHFPLRTFWPSEFADFMPFISANMDVIGELVGIDLEERPYPSFRRKIGKSIIDLLATDRSNGSNVVIELQVMPADEDHFRRLEKYHISHDARTIIWIAESFDPKIVAAVSEHNQGSSSSFRLFAIACRVRWDGKGRLTPYFITIVRPENAGALTAADLPNSTECFGELTSCAKVWATLLMCYPDERRRSHQWRQHIRYRKRAIAGWRVVMAAYHGEVQIWLRSMGRSAAVDLERQTEIIETRLGVRATVKGTKLVALNRRVISCNDLQNCRGLATWLHEEANAYEAMLCAL